jgi:ABC-type iron transport system FetAB ATPase subunit
MAIQDPSQLDLFVEQAEYLEDDHFEQWTVSHPDEELIIKKLSQAGAKLITGPRGCGKTTLLLKAYKSLCASPEQRTLPIYVNFKASLRLEPYYKSSANASHLFQQWLLYKVYAGLFTVLAQLKRKPPVGFRLSRRATEGFIEALESGRAEAATAKSSGISPLEFERDIDLVLEALDYRRCVLLLDDAAHAFSSEQQRDFFEFFRNVKGKYIAPKAAIYPGVTTFSPTFHVGHDAEEVDVWLRPDTNKYLPFMKSLLRQRVSDELWQRLTANETLLELLAYASFGVPRSLLNMLRRLYSGGDADESVVLDYTRHGVLRAIRASHEVTISVFSSLAKKLPMYEKFILAGRQILDRSVAATKAYNKGKSIGSQSVTIAVSKPIPAELAKVFAFFQYSGLLSPRGEVSRGEKGVFDLYVIHYAALIESNALFGEKAINSANYVEAFRKRSAKEFTRVTPRTLLNNQNVSSVLALSLPPCQVCKTPRVSEAARFCLNCGAPLTAMSMFETLIQNDIEELPLTPNRVASIKKNSKIRTVKDILLDHQHRELRSIPQIGPVWAKRIHSYAEEYLA